MLIALAILSFPLLLGAAPAAPAASAEWSGSEAPPSRSGPAMRLAAEDSWDRSTPRRAMQGYLEAARDGRWEDAATYLDLALVSGAASEVRGPTLARQLKVVLDRCLWIDLDALSDVPSGDADDGLPERRELIGTISRRSFQEDVLLERSPRAGGGADIWKVSAGTVARIPALYEEIGYGPLLDALPRVLLDERFLELALWQWIGLIAFALLAWLAGWVLSRVFLRLLRRLAMRTTSELDDRALSLASAPLRLLSTIGLYVAAAPLLRLSPPASRVLEEAGRFLVITAVAWLALRGIALTSTTIRERLERGGRVGASNLVPLGARAVKIAVLAIAALATLDTLGFDVTAVLAGLGVGGLAIALAAQKTVENVFGGVTILVDQPVRPGDFCRFGERMGTVEDIGIRSTRVRTLDRTLVTVPNAEFSALQIENFAARDRIRLITTLGLRYETTPDQLRYAIAGLRRVLRSHPRISREPQRVRLVAFGASSLDLEVLAYVETSDFDEFLGVREDVYLRFMDVVAASGTGFAFPSTTTYLASDSSLDSDKREAAEAAVSTWRSEGQLMFPEFSEEEVRSMEGTLDWPPRGSVSARSSAIGR